ncbi:MAG: acetyl-CoA C-acyltransferase [Rhizomicrobium sp.]
MTDIFLAPGLRTPFVKAGGVFAKHSALALSSAVASAMAAKARPDFLTWGQVIPDPTVSNIARELVFEAGLDPSIPAFSTVLACSTSFMAAVEAAGMIGRGGTHLALIGGVETMSHVPIALAMAKADAILATFRKDPAGAAAMLAHLTAGDFDLPIHGWVNKQSGRSQGEHTEDTVKYFSIARADQDERALRSHQGAIDGMDSGFFDDLIVPFDGVERDAIPRRDTSVEALARLKPAFAADGTLTAGNSSPLTDGAASLWVGDRDGIARLGVAPSVKLVDWELAAMDFRHEAEGILMSPARAIPRLLARHGLVFEDIGSWNIHEAFAAQVIANIRAASDGDYRRTRAGVDADLGAFPWQRVNPHGGSLALGHPFAATGARILSQAAKEMTAMPPGTRGIVSVCADGGQGTVALLERV